MGKATKIEQIPIDRLVAYKNNSKKHPEKQIKILMKSIEEFGFITPCLIDENNNIIAGHGRTEAAKQLGMKKIPCVRVEGLTEEQRKAYIIADNKLTELGGWDKDIVAAELSELDIKEFDISSIGFTVNDLQNIIDSQLKPYGAERERTASIYNMDMLENVQLNNDFWQMPKIKKQDYIPKKLVGFNYAKTCKDTEATIHFFIDDYQFERIWNDPEKYISILKKFECVISPEFSLYWNMPTPMQIWNAYRNRFIGALLQEYGITVIPSVIWADEKSFEFCFEGIEEGSIVAVETNGTKSKEIYPRWKAGMDELIKRIKPSTILVYGGKNDYDFGNINVIFYDNEVLKEWKKHET